MEAEKTGTTNEAILINAKNLYAQQNYAAAFPVFLEQANAGSAEAMYYLAQMYLCGEGTAEDPERGGFWLKQAADLGVVEAQYVYGMTALSDEGADYTKKKDGMISLGKAADAGNAAALQAYAARAAEFPREKEILDRAEQYNQKLEAAVTDAYEKQAAAERTAQLQTLKKALKKQGFLSHIGNISSCIGAFALILGFLYWLCGLHPQEYALNRLLRYLPQAPAVLTMPLSFLWTRLDHFFRLSGNTRLGLELIAFAVLLYMLVRQPGEMPRRYPSKVWRGMAWVIACLIIGWHFLILHMNGSDLLLGLSDQAILLAAAILAGWLAGLLLRLILRLR